MKENLIGLSVSMIVVLGVFLFANELSSQRSDASGVAQGRGEHIAFLRGQISELESAATKDYPLIFNKVIVTYFSHRDSSTTLRGITKCGDIIRISSDIWGVINDCDTLEYFVFDGMRDTTTSGMNRIYAASDAKRVDEVYSIIKDCK